MLSCASVDRTKVLLEESPRTVLARLRTREGERALHNALSEPDVPHVLLEAIRKRLIDVGRAIVEVADDVAQRLTAAGERHRIVPGEFHRAACET